MISARIMRYAGVGGTPSAFEILGRYVRAQAAQAASKN
jgi:hypothetical protein